MGLRHIFVKLRLFFVIAFYSVLVTLSYLLSFFLRFNSPVSYVSFILKTLPVLIVIKILIFYYFGLFHSSLRYASIFDLWQIIKANIAASAGFLIIVVFAYRMEGCPRSIFILDWGICLILTGGFKLSGRLIRERSSFTLKSRSKRAIIVGAGEAGIMVLRECRANPDMDINIVGFIDDDAGKWNLNIQGVKVLGGRDKIPKAADKYQIDEIIIAIPSAGGKTIRDILEYCQIKGVKIKIVPGMRGFLNGDLKIKLRDIQPEDLLGRETVKIDESEVRSYLKGKRVLITGAAGSIGSELCRQAAKFSPHSLTLVDYNENDMYFLYREFKQKYPGLPLNLVIGDVKDIGLLKRIFSKFKPQIVFHAAAFKHVPLMEEIPSSAIKNNVISTRNLVYASDHYKVERFVFISTDKAVNPTSVMGATKRIGEMIVQAKAKRSRTKFMAVRFGNVLGSKGSVIPIFKKQIEEGVPVSVTHPEARRYFMSTKEAVLLVLQAGAIGRGGEIFILDMGEQIKIVDLARDLITLYGLKAGRDIDIEFVGLRPGEKLYEEMFLNIEKDKATKHNKIYITQPNNFDPRALMMQVKILERLANMMDDEKILCKIKEFIPSYNPSNARLQETDL